MSGSKNRNIFSGVERNCFSDFKILFRQSEVWNNRTTETQINRTNIFFNCNRCSFDLALFSAIELGTLSVLLPTLLAASLIAWSFRYLPLKRRAFGCQRFM